MYPSSSSEDLVGTESIELEPMTEDTRYRGIHKRTDDPPRMQSYAVPAQSRWEILLRALGLSILWNIIAKIFRHPVEELPKQAMRKSRWELVMITATHVVPIIPCVVLIWLNFHGYYIGGELAGASGYDNLKLAGLQFAAKMHELMMQASLSLVVVSFLRHELVFGEGIPFGAVFGSLQFTNISYLWSKEFIGTLKASFSNKSRKAYVAAVIIVGSVLAVTVGPSSAIAMRPQSKLWAAGGTKFYLNATTDQIWPMFLDESAILSACSNVSLDMDCISKDWYTLSDGIIPYVASMTDRTPTPEVYDVASPKSMRKLQSTQRIGFYPKRWTLSTTQMSNLANAVSEIGRFWINAAVGTRLIKNWKYSKRYRWRNNVVYKINDIHLPVTSARCVPLRTLDLSKEVQDTIKVGIPLMTKECTSESPVVVSGGTEFQSQFLPYLNTTVPTLRFIDLPEVPFEKSTVGAVVIFPESWPGGPNIIGCGVDARWFSASIQSQRKSMRVVTGYPEGWELHGTCGAIPSPKNIVVTSKWANYLNPLLAESNLTVFHTLINTIPETNADRWTDDDFFVLPIIESIVGVLVTNGLARNAASAIPQGTLKGCTTTSCSETCRDNDGAWCKEILPKGEFGPGGEIYELPANANTSKMTQFTAEVSIDGYAYKMEGASIWLSIIVLTVYITVAIIHVVFNLITGLTSQAWDTISEVTALAMQSQPTRVLRNTSAGIVTTTIFTRMVRVVQTGEFSDHLELDFMDSEDIAEEKQPLIPDRFYE